MTIKKAKAVKPKTAKKPTASHLVDEARKAQALKEEKTKTSVLVRRIMQLEKEQAVLLALKKAKSFYKITPSKSVGSEAVAVMVASDWHIEEMVDLDQTSGLNEYDKEICALRVRRFFQHGLKLIQKEQKATHIETLVLALLGD